MNRDCKYLFSNCAFGTQPVANHWPGKHCSIRECVPRTAGVCLVPVGCILIFIVYSYSLVI